MYEEFLTKVSILGKACIYELLFIFVSFFGQLFKSYLKLAIPSFEVAGSIPARPVIFPRIDNSHCDRIHSSLTAVRCFDNGHVGKQPVARKEYCGVLVKRTPAKHR